MVVRTSRQSVKGEIEQLCAGMVSGMVGKLSFTEQLPFHSPSIYALCMNRCRVPNVSLTIYQEECFYCLMNPQSQKATNTNEEAQVDKDCHEEKLQPAAQSSVSSGMKQILTRPSRQSTEQDCLLREWKDYVSISKVWLRVNIFDFPYRFPYTLGA